MVNKLVSIQGTGKNDEGGLATVLSFAQSTNGFMISAPCRIDGLTLTQAGNSFGVWTGADSDGIVVQAGATVLSNLYIRFFKRHGVYVQGALPATNASLCYFNKVHTYSNAGSGFYITGTDANACSIVSCSAIANQAWGFRDNSFLGCYQFGNHSAENVLGGYTTEQAASSASIISCYSEAPEPNSFAGNGTHVVGGTWGVEPTTGWTWVNGKFTGGFRLGNSLFETRMGLSSSQAFIMWFNSVADLALKYQDMIAQHGGGLQFGTNRWLGWIEDNSYANNGIAMKGAIIPASLVIGSYNRRRQAESGQHIHDAIYLGSANDDGGAYRKITVGTTGGADNLWASYLPGDIIFRLETLPPEHLSHTGAPLEERLGHSPEA